MSTGSKNVACVPADMVQALRIGLYIEQSAATDALRHNPVPAGEQTLTATSASMKPGTCSTA
jgi:hypothetical protein